MAFRITRLLPAVLLACATSGTAQADTATASASLSGFKYELIDLDLNDGITPALTFQPAREYAAQSSYDPTLGGFEHDTRESIGATSLSMPFGNSTATVGATEWHVTASLNNPPLQDQRMQGFAMQRLYFDVTPATRVVFTADAVLSATDAGGRNAGWASVGFDGYFYPQQSDGRSIPIFSALETSDGNLSGTLRAELNTTQGGFGALLMKAHALTTVTVTPVPEPASVTMLVAGLALVGGAAWRRRR